MFPALFSFVEEAKVVLTKLLRCCLGLSWYRACICECVVVDTSKHHLTFELSMKEKERHTEALGRNVVKAVWATSHFSCGG